MQGFFDFVKSLGAARLTAMAAVSLALIGFFAFLMVRMTSPQMVPLFTDLTLEDSGSILKSLDRQGVPYELKNGGAVIMVPREKVARLRMTLAEDGLPKGGGVGYEIFDKSDALGATSFLQNINHLRALEGELSRTIRSLDQVEAARVHLVLPQRQLFSRDKVEASASIVLKVRGRLSAQQVRAVRHLVASAVTGLKPERISVVDETGKLLADGSGDDDTITAEGAAERKIAYETRLRKEVETIVDSVVGAGHARVQVTADFDMNRVTQTSDKYDPDGRVIRSSQTREETSSSGAGKAGGAVSVGNELPGSGGTGTGGVTNNDQTRKTEEVVNYEISHTTKTEVTEAGRIRRISAAVLVDGIYSKDAKGQLAYAPRSKEEIDRIAALVRSAIGFDAKRGDQVEVVNLRFAQPPTPPAINQPTGWLSALNFTKDDIMRATELGIMGLLGLVVVLLVVRPLVRRIVTPESAAAGRAGIAGVAGALGMQTDPAAIPASGPDATMAGHEEQVAISNRTSAMIDIAQVQGQVHAQSVQKVGELAEKNPHETVSIIRSWLHEDAA
ncbi:MAG TPA: flagellar basal-body MS-ring/collar protein FliF [Pseudolabrys sp.]|nr:flagellar basal-body MS-ring/collar protein FliF [Pseudolabrys sp.]